MNKAARIAFEEFLEEVSKESQDVKIIAPVLNVEGDFDGLPEPDLNNALQWFEIVEPLLYDYIFQVPGAQIEGKAIIAAQGIVEASYMHLEASYFESEGAEKAYQKYRRTGEIGDGIHKTLPPKLIVGPQKAPVPIEGQEFDDWLVVEAQGWNIQIILQKYSRDEHLWKILSDEDDPDSKKIPALSSEKLVKAAGQWKEYLLKFPPEPVRRKGASEDRRPEYNAAAGALRPKTPAQAERIEKRQQLLEERGIDERDPLAVCAVRTKKKFDNKELDSEAGETKIQIPRMPERARSLGKAPRRTLRTVDVKKRWEATAKQCGLLLEPFYSEQGDLIGYSPPLEDFLFADELFDRSVLSMPSPEIEGLWPRNVLTKPDRRKKDRKPDLLIVKSLERRRREKKDARGRPWSTEMKLREMGTKFPLGTEPKVYLLGPRTGNLYPAKFISYGEHLGDYLPGEFRKRYGHLFTSETVLALLLRQPPYLPQGQKKQFTYLPPGERLVVCFEDELMNILQGQELMRMADLHRYLENPLTHRAH